MTTFSDLRIEKYFEENSHDGGDSYYFKVPAAVAFDPASVFNTMLAQMIPVQAYVVSDKVVDGCLIYMCIKPALIKFNRLMLNALFAPDATVQVNRIRAFVELTAEQIALVPYPVLNHVKAHPTEDKIICALNEGGRHGALNHQQLAAAVEAFGVDNIILDSEIEQYEQNNGYNTEEPL